MKKNFIILFALLVIIGLSNKSFADNIFGNDIITPPASTSATQTNNGGNSAVNQSLQTSLSNLESAEQDLNNKLQMVQSNYATIDAEYKRVKAERAELKKLVNSTKRQIRTVEKTQKNIQKTLQAEK